MSSPTISLPFGVFEGVPPNSGPDAAWLPEVSDSLRESGAVLVRGLSPEVDVESLVSAITGEDPLEYSGGATPRTRVGGRVYTSTDFPADLPIDLHSEMAYSSSWPNHLGFFSVEAAAEGGQTPLASTRAVVDQLPGDLVERLRSEGVTYVRRFDPLLGVDWSEAYDTVSFETAVERAARRGEELVATADGAAASITLPAFLGDGPDERWFNQMVAYNARTLPAEIYADLVEVRGADGFLKDTRFGGGESFTATEIDAVRAAVDEVAVTFPWGDGDLLVVDNREFTHGRRPYRGSRQLRVCMTGRGNWPTFSGGTDEGQG